MLAGAFITDFTALVARWAEWARTEVENWPENPADAPMDPSAMEAVVRRAESGDLP